MDVIMDEAGTVPVGFNRGPWSGRMLSDNGMVLHFATPSYTAGTKGVQRGHVLLEPRSREEFDRMKGALKGAWVLIGGKNNGWPVDWSPRADSARAAIMAWNDSIARINRDIMRENMMNRTNPPRETLPLKEEPALFYREMCEAGILGVIQSSEVPIRALYDRKNLERITFDNLPTVCDIKLDENQYNIIAEMAKERQYFLLEFDIRNYFRPGPVKYYSVIGVIKGKKYPNEYVMMGGHLDAFDVATGGVDCGSGLSVTMAAVWTSVLRASGIAGSLLGGWLSDRWGNRQTVLLSLIAIGPVVLLFSTINLFAAVAVLMIAIGILWTMRETAVQTYLMGRTPLHLHGIVFGLYFGIGMQGQSLLQPVYGTFMDMLGISNVFLIVSFISVATSIVTIFMARKF